MIRALLLSLLLAPVVHAQTLDDEIHAVATGSYELLEPPPRKYRAVGTLQLHFDNDAFGTDTDDRFSAGFGLSWTSVAVGDLDYLNGFRRMVEDYWSFLPMVGNHEFDKHFQITVGYELYTPSDLSTPVPNPGEHPYCSLFAVDTGVYALGEESMHAYIIRLGWVGPANGGGEIQKWLHEQIGSPDLQGWDSQHGNEPILNLFYLYQRRVARWEPLGLLGPAADFSINGSAGVGNFYIGANVGAQVRVGIGLPRNFSRANPLGLHEEVPGRFDANRWISIYFYAQVSVGAIGRFLPTDGSTFEDSYSVDRDDFGSTVVVGMVAMIKRLQVGVYYNVQATTDLNNPVGEDYATITASWTF